MCIDNENCICEILKNSCGKKRTIYDCKKYARYNNGECLSTNYVDCKTRLEWKCQCGYSWFSEFDRILKRNQWCKICAKEKAKATFLVKYGVENPQQNKEVQEKTRKTNLARYGAINAMQNKEVQDKVKKTYFNRTGYENPLSNPEVLSNIKQNNISKYGTISHLSSQEIINKRVDTNLARYGAINAMQNKEVQDKCAKAVNKNITKHHWLTNEELVCQGSWEAKVVDYLNLNQINYKWQPETFKLSTGKTYRPDLYLADSNTWIEIKGWMRDDAKLKWDEFKSIHPTAELWDKQKLKQLGVL